MSHALLEWGYVVTELGELRTWPTDRPRASRDDAVREERRWQMRHIAIDRGLSERGATDARDAVEWVAARDGVRQAAPSHPERLVRRQRVVTAEEMAARRAARELRWRRKGKMLRLSGAIPDIDGALVEAVLEVLVGGMRPPKGQPWDTRAHRGADALVALCGAAKNGAPADGNVGGTRQMPKRGWKPSVVIHMGSDAQPTVNGMPIAVETV